MAAAVTCLSRRALPQILRLNCSLCTRSLTNINKVCSTQQRYGVQSVASLHTSSPRQDLMEFIEPKENWGEKDIKVGRPWKKDELRLKDNTDLHKLWYVLLKERNMLMTMEDEYKRLNELFPSPERIEKVEESMENLLDVVTERDRAYHLCEEGITGEGGERRTYDFLGREFLRRNKEHYVPKEMTGKKERRYQWQQKFLRLQREKDLIREDARRLNAEKRAETQRRLFPSAQKEES